MLRGIRQSLAIILMAGCVSTAGCGESATDGLVVLWGLEPRVAQPLLDQFERETGIAVQPIMVPYSARFEKIATAGISGAAGFDVVMVDTIWTPQFAAAGWVVDITDEVSASDLDSMLPGTLDSVRYHNRLYGLPLYTDAKFFYYHEAMLREAGLAEPPRTLDAFTRDAVKLTRQVGGHKVWGTVWSWKQAEGLICDWVVLAYASDPRPLFDGKGQPRFEESGGVAALRWMVDLLYKYRAADPGSLTFTENEVRDHFLGGRSAMMLNWEGVLNKQEGASPGGMTADVKRALIPGATAKRTASVLGPEGLAIMSSSPKKAEALQLLHFLTRPDMQRRLFESGGDLPIERQVLEESSQSMARPDWDMVCEQLEHARSRPGLVNYLRVSDILQAEIHKALLREKSPREALQDAAKRIDALAAAPS